MENFKPKPIEEYVEDLVEYSAEQKENVRNFRGNLDYMSFEQFNFLFQQKIVERRVKLKTPRSLWVDGITGKIWYLNHYKKHFDIIGKFIQEYE